MRKRSLSTNRSAELAARAHAMRRGADRFRAKALVCASRRSRRGSRVSAPGRQVVIGERIVDFVALAAKLVLEVDGGYHSVRASADARRDAELARAGYRLVRIDALLAMRSLPQAVASVRVALHLE